MSDATMCQEYQAQLEQHFGELLEQRGFTLADCDCEFGGRAPECVAMASNATNRLLFTYSDGAFNAWIGTAQAEFPGQTTIAQDGSAGWYLLALLVQTKTGKPAYSPQTIDQFHIGAINQLQFEAELLTTWADEFLPYVLDVKKQQAFAKAQETPIDKGNRRGFFGRLFS